ncbi:hypothetical protein ACHAWT_002954 [Skeletonema menzelii]
MSILSKTTIIVTAVLFGCCCYASAFVNNRLSNQPIIVKQARSIHPTPTTIFNSSDNNNDPAEDSENSRPEANDPDGVPLFDTNDRATLFGLEPNAEMDPLDNPGLQFTGPLIMFLSIYITLSLFFAGDGTSQKRNGWK